MTRIVTMQDISCVGQCSITVALPILSTCGIETAVLPSAVLSTHTGGFTGYTFRDLTEDIPKIQTHWEKEGIQFDALYTGYLGSTRQIELVKELMTNVLREDAPTFIDPAMADNGTLYPGFDHAFVEAMKTLIAKADVALPNITEACLLTDTPYPETYDESFVDDLCHKLLSLGAKTVVLTGVGYREGKTGVVVYSSAEKSYYEHEKIAKGAHGTGDIYASAFVGATMRGHSMKDAAKIAADFTVLAIKETQKDPDHWYGAKFESQLGALIQMLEQ